MRDVTARASSPDQPVTSEKLTHGSASGPDAARVALGQKLEEFLRAPGRMVATSFYQCLNEIRLGLVRAGFGLAGAVFKTRDRV